MSAAEWGKRFEELAEEARNAGYFVSLAGHCCPDAWIDIVSRTNADDAEECSL